jgi:aspartate-semialdehyde dehydrogenase
VEECKPNRAPRLLFSSMDSSVATEIERAFAEAGHIIVSNSKNHRMELDVPLLVPEVNPDHLKIVPLQQRQRPWKGQIVTNPNCATVSLVMGLAPLKPFGITQHVPGNLRRRLPWRAVDGHQRQRDSVHRRRRGENGAGDAEDPG